MILGLHFSLRSFNPEWQNGGHTVCDSFHSFQHLGLSVYSSESAVTKTTKTKRECVRACLKTYEEICTAQSQRHLPK